MYRILNVLFVFLLSFLVHYVFLRVSIYQICSRWKCFPFCRLMLFPNDGVLCHADIFSFVSSHLLFILVYILIVICSKRFTLYQWLSDYPPIALLSNPIYLDLYWCLYPFRVDFCAELYILVSIFSSMYNLNITISWTCCFILNIHFQLV